MKPGKIFYSAIIFTLLVSACGTGPAATTAPEVDKPTEVAASATIVPTDIPTVEPTAIPTEEPTATQEPTATPTEEPTATPTEEPTAEPEPEINERFVPPFVSDIFYIDSDIAEKEWMESMDGLARNQAIAKPYEWQLVGVPDSTKWSDIFPYFKEYLVEKGWAITSDGGSWVTIGGGNTMYVGGFTKTEDGKKLKISLLFYPKFKESNSKYIVFYSERK